MDENIRDPDQPFYDRLIGDYYASAPPAPAITDYVDEDSPEYANILQQSLEEYESQYESQQKQVYKEIEKEKAERQSRFENVKKMCRRLLPGSLAKDKSTLELFLYFIELYETDFVNSVNVEPAFYDCLFSILTSTRLSREDIELCRNFIVIAE